MMTDEELKAFYSLSVSEDKDNHALVRAYPREYRQQLCDFILANLDMLPCDIESGQHYNKSIGSTITWFTFKTKIVFDLYLIIVCHDQSDKLAFGFELRLMDPHEKYAIQFNRYDTDSVARYYLDIMLDNIKRYVIYELADHFYNEED